MNNVSKAIQDRISAIGDPKKAQWLENYVKHKVRSKGVGIPDIRKIVKEVHNEYKLGEQKIPAQIDLLNHLMEKEYTEDKLAAILYLQLFWKNRNEKQTLEVVSLWFDKEWITDWNVCDWLCVRILTPMVDSCPEIIIPELKKWNKAKNQWKARASLVPLAQAKTIKDYVGIIKGFSEVLVKREERFCKTSVGWVLREYSKIDSKFVAQFLSDFETWTTKEVVKNATKYMRA